ncbi:hypothetical protein [Stenoxybacter acetivorans]|uniref:hypothetical protein n=1 Tax=Stenoxybacter acetivorans TaxID=422441 RepID=UPI0012EB0BA9|nr:hypothetical protein [Stenoxybacter acetivorans]
MNLLMISGAIFVLLGLEAQPLWECFYRMVFGCGLTLVAVYIGSQYGSRKMALSV